MLFLTEDDVRQLLTMDAALGIVEQVFRDLGAGKAQNISRGRAKTDHVMLHLLGGAADGMVGYKAYSTSKAGAKFHVGLFDGATGQPLALIEADLLGQIRTGAASGVATKHLARLDANRLGVIGTGKQAWTQVLAVARVRELTKIRVYSRDEKKREAFVVEMMHALRLPLEAVSQPEDAVRDCDIVITATASKSPVLDGAWLEPGTHLNVIGSNFRTKAEVDVTTFRRCSLVTVDDKEQARLEAGDFVGALTVGALTWTAIHNLSEILTGQHPGRTQADDITLFKSLGLGVEDVAVAAHIYREALRRNLGHTFQPVALSGD